MNLKIVFLSMMLICVCGVNSARASLNVDRLSDDHIAGVKNLIKKLEPFILKRDKTKDLAKLTFDELYSPLNEQEQAFLKSFQNIDAKKLGVKIPYRGIATGKEDLVLIVGQKVKVRDHKKEGTKRDQRELAPQFLPRDVFTKYTAMMEAMQKDIGKKLLVESGYRSSAYQLYLFVYYLQNHKYSIRETVKFVALPGYSEHGAPAFQAIDFINVDGFNGEDNTSEFDTLPEFAWLQKNAQKFGFVLSYPKDAPVGITYEPWHWRCEAKKK
ncbi:MAG: M15 family metallopeptidase [Candidatus Omnitrophica bacterium]|nr:M15 family metallopeptidase [Candidatus Omnitrophota bacterium]